MKNQLLPLRAFSGTPLKALSVCLLVTATLHLEAQVHNVKVQLSEEYEEPKNSIVFDVIGYDDDGVYLGRYQRKGFYNLTLEVEKYSHALKLLGLRDYEYEVSGEDMDYGSPFYFQSKLYATGMTYSKKTKKRNIYYHELDKKTLTAKGAPTLMQSIQESDNGSVSLAENVMSPDESKLAFFGIPGYQKKMMILSGIPITRGKDREKIEGTVQVYDKGMQEIWSGDFSLPYEEKLYDIKGAKLDDAGNFYILGRVFKETAKTKKRGLPNYEYVVSIMTDNGKSIKDVPISLDDKFITDCSFTISPQNKIICAGFYSDKGTASIKGTFYMTIDPETKQVSAKGIKEFDAEYLKLFMSDKKAEKGEELSDYDLDQIIVREDGGAVLLGEQFYITTYQTYNATTKSYETHTVYHYNDIIVININPDNSIEWAAKVPKKQASSSGFYLSYATHVKDNMLYLIFNDNDKNLDEKNPDKIYPYDGKNSIATLVTVQPDGDWNKSALFSNKEEGVIMRPSVSEQINDDELIIYCEKGRKYEIGKISFE